MRPRAVDQGRPAPLDIARRPVVAKPRKRHRTATFEAVGRSGRRKYSAIWAQRVAVYWRQNGRP